MGTRVPTTIHNPIISFITYEGADQVAYILTDWLKGQGVEPSVYAAVERVRDAMQAITDDTDVIMLEDS
jgi:hypothetical protein